MKSAGRRSRSGQNGVEGANKYFPGPEGDIINGLSLNTFGGSSSEVRMHKRSGSWRGGRRLLGAGLCVTLTWWGGLAAGGWAADGADMLPQGNELLVPSLREVLYGGSPPRGLEDLRAMQSHFQRLAQRVMQCTVGVQVGQAWGSGVIVSADGLVLTAAHVAGRPNRDCTFTLHDGREVHGKTLGLFRTLDAGLMKITEPGEYPHAPLGDASQVREGQWCLALGHPGGYQSDRGLVLRVGRVLLVQKDAITTDCTLVGGDSGGPLFDMEGRVIGINSRIAGSLAANLHVPVSAYQAQGAWDRLVRGEVWGHLPGQAPYLGVVGDPDAQEARIMNVKAGSPAEKYGLKPGDVIIGFDDKEIPDFAALKEAVAGCEPNESVKLRVRRGGEILTIRVRLAKDG